MATVELDKAFEGKPPGNLYDAALKALPKMGFNIWRKFPLGNVLMSKQMVGGKQVDCSFIAHLGSPLTVSITVKSDGLGETELRPWAEKVMAALEESL
ncbi:MAG TPA: hypothetical protein VMC62_05290 [Longilinea sp.]|nr:hypothetical protein [Longilinea sp.]